jgi:hypothetical protein
MDSDTTVDLAVCSGCGGRFVQPLGIGASAPGTRLLTLHCPECDLVVAGSFDQATVDRYDAEMDRGFGELASCLDALHEVNELEAIQRFRRALDCDAILPEDFGRPAALRPVQGHPLMSR